MAILLCVDLPKDALKHLLRRYHLGIEIIVEEKIIPGSFWGDTEAGLIDNILYIQHSTPVHSALHEACHYVCMDTQRRTNLDTNAGGDYDEENAVCYLQLILADYLENYSQKQQFDDMDDWGYSFRLGSAKRWFKEDAEDAKQWLMEKNLINQQGKPNWSLRLD